MEVNTLTPCPPSEFVSLERTRFFARQLITPDDLTQDQVYFREKLRRHNRMLHGWGVVCGARVRAVEETCEVVVEPGYLLGPYGDEILIEQEVTVDLCREGLDGDAVAPCGAALDPWCSDVRVGRRAGQTLYLAVRYAECSSRPVRVQAGGCGCDLAECEYSRVRDSYAIKVLTQLPASYSDPMTQPGLEGVFHCDREAGRACAPCPTEPWVVLADITLGEDENVATVDCFAHRRYVVSFASYYYLCRPDRKRDTYVRRAEEVAAREGRPVLLDVTTGAEELESAAVASVRLAGGRWASMPVYFGVEEGETVSDLLEREGDREFYDPSVSETYTLRELYALAEVEPDTPLRDVSDAAAPLEGLHLNVGDLRVVRTGFEGLIDAPGLRRLDREFAGAPGAVTRLPALDISGVGGGSTLGERLAGVSIGDITDMSRDDFMDMVLEGVEEAERDAVEAQARTVYTAARRVKALRTGWRP